MSLSFRMIAAVGILMLGTSGCGQEKGTVAKAGSEKVEASAASKGTTTRSKSPSTRSASKGESGGEAKAGRRVSTLTAADDGESFDLRQGQVLSVMLSANHGTGLAWVLVEPAGTVLVREGTPVYVAKKGGSGTETWHFKAVRTGRQTVRLEYRRKWTQSVPDRTFRFTATVR